MVGLMGLRECPDSRRCAVPVCAAQSAAQLAIRDFVAYAFDRSRFREALSALVIAIGVLPQLLLRTGIAYKFKRSFSRLRTAWLLPGRTSRR